MFCPNCGKEIGDNQSFCSFCGANQGQSAAQTPQPTPPKKNNTLVLAIVAVVAVLAIVLGIFVIAPALLSGDKSPDVQTNQSAIVNAETDENKDKSETPAKDTSSKKLTELEFGLVEGRAFQSNLDGYGDIQLSFGFDKDTGLVKQMTASIKISQTNSEYESFKTDFETVENKLKLMNDKNASATYNQFVDYISCFYSFQNLNAADRSERVKIASEELDIPYNQNNFAFYINDITNKLVNEYGFEIVD